MIETPVIIQTTPRIIAVIHITVPKEDVRKVMGPGLGELRAALAAQGISATGPWFTHHFKRPLETFDFEICLPVAAPVSENGRVRPGLAPAMTVARTVYHGRYEGLAEAWRELSAWVTSIGRSPSDELWECYVAGPESSKDPADWRTELSRELL